MPQQIATPADVQALMEKTQKTQQSGPPSASSADVDALLGSNAPEPQVQFSYPAAGPGGYIYTTKMPKSQAAQLTEEGRQARIQAGLEALPSLLIPFMGASGPIASNLWRLPYAAYGAYKGGHIAQDFGAPKWTGQVAGGATGLAAPELASKFLSRAPLLRLLMSRYAPAAAEAEEPAAAAGAAREMAGGTAGTTPAAGEMAGGNVGASATTPARSLVLSPEEAQTEAVLNKVAQRMASQRGMRYAAGMNPGLPEPAPTAAPIRATPFGESPQAQSVKELLGSSLGARTKQTILQAIKRNQ